MDADATRLASADPGPFFYGTKADLSVGDLLKSGESSNFGTGKSANFVYFTATLDAAVWVAELARGDAPCHVYLVEPGGRFEDDPNLTDTRFPGSRTRSYRTREPLRVVGEVQGWRAIPPRFSSPWSIASRNSIGRASRPSTSDPP
jgi:rifampin ADP-ribosylating transferase